jgi:hypothetical protein
LTHSLPTSIHLIPSSPLGSFPSMDSGQHPQFAAAATTTAGKSRNNSGSLSSRLQQGMDTDMDTVARATGHN